MATSAEGFRYPVAADNNNVPQDLLNLVTDLDGKVTKVEIFTTSGTYTKPTNNPKAVEVYLIGAGGGGGSGRRGAASTYRQGGGGGGGGERVHAVFRASDVAASETITVSNVGGTAGAAVTTDNTNGNNGSNGTASSFGTKLVARGGGQGLGGGVQLYNNGNSGNGVGPFSGTGTAYTFHGSGTYGSGDSIVGATPPMPGTPFVAPGGGGGGGLDTSNATSNGSAGASSGVYAGGAAGTSSGGAGGAGTSAPANTPVCGGSGGGGGWNGGTGGAAGNYGAGGGGGGGSTNGTNSGAGGAGGAGLCIVITHF